MNRIIAIILLSISSASIFTQSLEIPAYTGEITVKENYTLKYNEKFEQAEWVAYELTKNEVLGNVERKDSFKTDPSIATGSATLDDYRGSGYDRGHLVPAADMKMNETSMSESFYMSNMSPQVPGFNRGIWAMLEEYVRTWAYDNGSVYIVTGPVLTKPSYPTIGTNKVAVPEYFYKVVLDYTGDERKAIGFILPNEKSTKPLSEYAVSVDTVEEFTGIDFYPLLEDSIENEIESNFNITLWPLKQYKFDTPDVSIEENKKYQVTKTKVKYWINSSSMTRHNSSCRYYNNTKNGYYSDTSEGKACNSCGG